MAEETKGKRGRPVGTRIAVVELDTLSFKAPKEFVARVRQYSKDHRQSVSAMVRDGLTRYLEDDPLSYRYGTVTSGETAYEGNTSNTEKIEKGVEFLHGMLSALVEEVRQLRESMQTIEQRLGETGRVQAPSVTGNTSSVPVDGDIPVASMKAQMGEPGSMQAPSVTGNTDVTSVNGDMPVASMKAQSTLGRTSVRVLPEFDPAKYALGPLCEHGHDADGQGHSLRQRGGKHECRECKNTRSRAYKERRRQAQPVSG